MLWIQYIIHCLRIKLGLCRVTCTMCIDLNTCARTYIYTFYTRRVSPHTTVRRPGLWEEKSCSRNRLCKLKGATFFTQKFKLLVALPQPHAIAALFESLLLLTKFLKNISLTEQCELISLPNGKHNYHHRKRVRISQSDSHQYEFHVFALTRFKERTEKKTGSGIENVDLTSCIKTKWNETKWKEMKRNKQKTTTQHETETIWNSDICPKPLGQPSLLPRARLLKLPE